MSAPLSVQNMVKSYDSKRIIDGVSFAAEPGEFLVLVGSSGCGKSTILRSIAGLESIDSGQILIDHADVAHKPPKDRDIAMVFQDYALYPHKTVYENIAFGLRIRKTPPARIDELVRYAADKLNLTPYLTRKPAALSGGQRQRVAIGRAIVRKPKVFLFDEPLSNLDAKLRVDMRYFLSMLHEELKTTSVYVTHDQVEAMTLADKIIVLDKGRIQQMGPPMSLYYHPKNVFVATFLGSPQMNTIAGRLQGDGDDLHFQSAKGLQFQIPEKFKSTVQEKVAKNQELIWGVRPENLKMGGGEVNSFRGQVSVREPLGPSTTVLLDISGHDINVNIPEPHRPHVGDAIDLNFASKHLYLFDKMSGESIIDS